VGALIRSPDKMPTPLWVAFGGIAIVVAVLCSPPGLMVAEPSVGRVVMTALVIWFGYATWRRIARAVAVVVSDAVATLSGLEFPR
jgi:uncharacterized membrane protein